VPRRAADDLQMTSRLFAVALVWCAVFGVEAAMFLFGLGSVTDLALLALPFVTLAPLYYLAKGIPQRYAALAAVGGAAYGLLFVTLNLMFVRLVRVEFLGVHHDTFHLFAQLYQLLLFPLISIGSPIVALLGTKRGGRQ
jgi:hypothetical protein